MIDHLQAFELAKELEQLDKRKKLIRRKLCGYLRANQQNPGIKDNHTLQRKLNGYWMTDFADCNLIFFTKQVLVNSLFVDNALKLMKGETINVQKSSDD